jgi:hypothetical protein
MEVAAKFASEPISQVTALDTRMLDAIRIIEKASNSYGNDLFIQHENAAK